MMLKPEVEIAASSKTNISTFKRGIQFADSFRFQVQSLESPKVPTSTVPTSTVPTSTVPTSTAQIVVPLQTTVRSAPPEGGYRIWRKVMSSEERDSVSVARFIVD